MSIETWFIAFCLDCPQFQPFRSRERRTEWAFAHQDQTGHCVGVRIERRESGAGS